MQNKPTKKKTNYGTTKGSTLNVPPTPKKELAKSEKEQSEKRKKLYK